MTTAADVIARTLRILGVYGAGESASAEEAADCLEALNDMIAGWATERLLVHSVNEITATLTPGTASYSVGAGADIDTPRPLSMETMFIRISEIDYPVTKFSRSEYQNRASKDTSSLPERYYYDASYPNGTLHLWQKPDIAYELHFDAVQPFTAFTGLTDTATFPGEYGRLLKFGLAVEMAPEYGKTLSPDIISTFQDAKRNIKRNNSFITPARFDIGARGTYNISADT